MQGITISTYKTDSKVPADSLPLPFQVPVINPSLQAVSSQGIFDAMNDQLRMNPASNKPSEFVAASTIPPAINVQPQPNTSAGFENVGAAQFVAATTIPPVVNTHPKPNTSAGLGNAENIGPPPLTGFVKRSPFMH